MVVIVGVVVFDVFLLVLVIEVIFWVVIGGCGLLGGFVFVVVGLMLFKYGVFSLSI